MPARAIDFSKQERALKRDRIDGMMRLDDHSYRLPHPFKLGPGLRGGLCPPLTPEALAGKPAAHLKTMILDSRPGTAMPRWRLLRREAEAAWIAGNLARGIPDAR